MYKVKINVVGRSALRCSQYNPVALPGHICTNSADAHPQRRVSRPLATQHHAVQLPEKSRVVICGGGLIGAAVAYHLGLSGMGAETVVIEQDR